MTLYLLEVLEQFSVYETTSTLVERAVDSDNVTLGNEFLLRIVVR